MQASSCDILVVVVLGLAAIVSTMFLLSPIYIKVWETLCEFGHQVWIGKLKMFVLVFLLLSLYMACHILRLFHADNQRLQRSLNRRQSLLRFLATVETKSALEY